MVKASWHSMAVLLLRVWLLRVCIEDKLSVRNIMLFPVWSCREHAAVVIAHSSDW